MEPPTLQKLNMHPIPKNRRTAEKPMMSRSSRNRLAMAALLVLSLSLAQQKVHVEAAATVSGGAIVDTSNMETTTSDNKSIVESPTITCVPPSGNVWVLGCT